MGTKQDVLERIFLLCKQRNDFVFDNDLVKAVCKELHFGNPFDATKLDDTSKFPQVLLDEDYFVVHLGEGKHRFVKGIRHGYHPLEGIEAGETLHWKYRKSVLNESDTSESNILSVATNQRILHDFLYDDIVASPKVYGARRTKIDMSYRVGTETIVAKNLQMEIDLTLELGGVVTVVEGKNGTRPDFALYQLFHPFAYYQMLKAEHKLDIHLVTCCYILRTQAKCGSALILYNYTFENASNLGSVKLLKKARYDLVRR